MFKIFTLDPDAPSELDNLQSNFEIASVQLIGKDSQFNPYLLVQYWNKGDAPLTGSVVVDDPGTSGSLDPSGSLGSGSFDPTNEDLKQKKAK